MGPDEREGTVCDYIILCIGKRTLKNHCHNGDNTVSTVSPVGFAPVTQGAKSLDSSAFLGG